MSVIVLLEEVHIDEKNRQRRTGPLRLGPQGGQGAVKGTPVPDPGQPVLQAEPFESVLRLPQVLLRDEAAGMKERRPKRVDGYGNEDAHDAWNNLLPCNPGADHEQCRSQEHRADAVDERRERSPQLVGLRHPAHRKPRCARHEKEGRVEHDVQRRGIRRRNVVIRASHDAERQGEHKHGTVEVVARRGPVATEEAQGGERRHAGVLDVVDRQHGQP